MLLPRFDYIRAKSLSEALEALDHYGQEAKVLAGGTDLLVNLKQRKLTPKKLVSLSQLEELRQTKTVKGKVNLGALCTAAQLAALSGLKSRMGVIAQAAGVLGSPQVRNRATLGGNMCTARPAADLPLPFLVLGAEARLVSPQGERLVPLSEFFLGPGITEIRPHEILTHLQMDKPGPGSGGDYIKLGLRQALEISLVNVAVYITLEKDSRHIEKARVALGAVGPTPIRAASAEKLMQGGLADQRLFARAAEAAAKDARPIDDHRGSAEYRREMVKVLTKRALTQALKQAVK